MPFREKAKNLFKPKTRSGSSSANSNESLRGSNHDVYKPGERMPQPKYRRPALKEHTEKLESFSFADAWRKRSFQSSHSPMGTAAQSRRTSFASIGRRSRKSVTNASRTNSVSTQSDVAVAKPKDGHACAAAPPRLATELENEGDDNVANVGVSGRQSREHGLTSRPRTAEDHLPPMSTAHDHQPFSEQDLANALHRSRLQVPAH